jgi:hypothetical protein
MQADTFERRDKLGEENNKVVIDWELTEGRIDIFIFINLGFICRG